MTPQDLIDFETEIADLFAQGKIRSPVHFSSPEQAYALSEIFKNINPVDWVFCSYRNHFHALLHGIPRDEVKSAILAGHSMTLSFPRYRFYSSAIVGGMLPIACGVAAAIKRRSGKETVWCFLGDMAAKTGISAEVRRYTLGHSLPLHWVVENNGLSVNSPTEKVWGEHVYPIYSAALEHYLYTRTYPHVCLDRFVQF